MKKILKHYFITVLAATLFVTSLSGCADTEAERETETAEEAVFPMTVTDQTGRTVTLSAPAERIASSYYISTALFVALGLEDNLVGIEKKADTRKLYELAAPQIVDLPAIGSGKELNIEEIAAVEPDLVVIPKKLKDNVDALEKLEIPVLVVDPESQEDFLSCIELLGKVTDRNERAEALIRYCNDKMQEMKGLTEDLERPTVYIGSGSSFLSTAPGSMYQNDLIEMAGGVNAGKDLPDGYWTEISKEQLAEWNPDYIFAVSYASYTTDDIREDESLSEINALKNGCVYTFPSRIEAWDYPTPSSVLGVMWLTHILHPEVYSEEQYVREAESFYQEYFEIEVTEEDLGLR